MATLFRFDPTHNGNTRRCTAGVQVSSACTEVVAALVSAVGRGLDTTIDVVGVATAAVSKETTALFSFLSAGGSAPTGSLATVRAQLAETQVSLVAKLLTSSGVAPDRVLAVGAHDPGIWKLEGGKAAGYLGLCDPARLAESTGLNVIDAFPARDLAQGGQGGPVSAVAQWVVLRHPDRNRVLLDLGRTTRMSYLPAEATDHAASRILAFDVGPGTDLLDLLAERLTDGQHRFDPGGRLAVQGRRIDELVHHWLADPYFDRPPPRWHPSGVRPQRFLADSLEMAVRCGWSVRDLLCSATHFIAETAAQTLRRRLPEDAAVDEIVVVGGGQQNGMLLREIGRTTEIPLVRIGELGICDDALDPAAVAVLALLYLDQIPANPTAITDAEIPRVLGRLTSGSPKNYRQLLHAMADSRPDARPLRSALQRKWGERVV